MQGGVIYKYDIKKSLRNLIYKGPKSQIIKLSSDGNKIQIFVSVIEEGKIGSLVYDVCNTPQKLDH